MTMFVVEGGMGRLVMAAHNSRSAVSICRKKYGTVNDPIIARAASQADMVEHLRGGAVFFDEDGSIMDPFDAYPLAGLAVPQKFARAS